MEKSADCAAKTGQFFVGAKSLGQILDFDERHKIYRHIKAQNSQKDFANFAPLCGKGSRTSATTVFPDS
jgi:hypothetical protein